LGKALRLTCSDCSRLKKPTVANMDS
jgi:hypothetical protein